MSVKSCAEPTDQRHPTLGAIAKFDPESGDSQCQRLYENGTPYERNTMVHRFCSLFDKGAIPERCKCYRFQDTADYQQYSSLWADLVAKGDSGATGDPLIGSYACFYEPCQTPGAYLTTQLQNPTCPDVVYCKQNVGGIDVTRGKDSLKDIAVRVQQCCGGDKSKCDSDGNSPNNTDAKADVWAWAAPVVGIVVVVIMVVVIMSLLQRRRIIY